MYTADMDTIGHIQNLGFSVYESHIISALLEAEEPTVKDIAQLSSVPKNKVYELLEKLQDESVVEVLQIKPKRFRLLNLEEYIARKEKDHAEAYNVSSAKVRALLKARKVTDVRDREVWTTEGAQAMLTKINQVLKSIQKESIAFIDVWVESRENYAEVEKAINRGVKFYFLGPLNAQSKPIIKKYLALGVDVRVFPVESAGYSIFDAEQVQVRVSSKKVISLWIKNKYLSTILREHFFQHWKKAKKVKL